jgi:hypothetical protein
MYGTHIVEFAEKAVAGRRPIARGECWDVAAEALNTIEREHPELPKPFPSISRTHGHLIYYSRAGGEGKWRGGDAYVRPGDIVEWRSVRITEVGAPYGSYSTLGDPEVRLSFAWNRDRLFLTTTLRQHTAIITAAGEPTSLPEADEPYPISALTSLTVVEQSKGHNPTERTYDLTAMTAGEIWIYRPVSLVELTGTEISASWPPSCETWQVGELE